MRVRVTSVSASAAHPHAQLVVTRVPVAHVALPLLVAMDTLIAGQHTCRSCFKQSPNSPPAALPRTTVARPLMMEP